MKPFFAVVGENEPELSAREAALNMPPRAIKRTMLLDRNKYKGEELRRLRAVRGVGQVRRLTPAAFSRSDAA